MFHRERKNEKTVPPVPLSYTTKRQLRPLSRIKGVRNRYIYIRKDTDMKRSGIKNADIKICSADASTFS
ncbi:MAG TPA: hypothetical protein DGU38_12270 [Parabacteroides merdae]|nr:hypothetical protein [Parabacteroides merdae]HCW16082.1 hypothetical protein [Parabacteroides merdae]